MIFNPQIPTFLNIPPVKRFEGQIRLPGSKSLSNRAFLLAALCKGETRLHHLLSSDDTRYMSEGLRALGVSIELSEDSSEAKVCGADGKFPAKSADMFLGNVCLNVVATYRAICVCLRNL